MVKFIIGLIIGFLIGFILCFYEILKMEEQENHRIKTILERDERKNGDRKNNAIKNRRND